MWSAIRWLVLRFAALRWLFKLGGLAFLLPIALFLKSIGLPLLIVLAVLAIPVLLLLLLFGLPIFLVMIFGSMVMGILGFVLTLGLAAVKIGLLVVLPIWIMWMICSKTLAWSRKRGGDSGGCGPSTPTPDPTSDTPGTGPADGIDPA
ncbi:MAG: hypothetical protein ABJF01_25120 [bacterium]